MRRQEGASQHLLPPSEILGEKKSELKKKEIYQISIRNIEVVKNVPSS
jgi:hypothetical protein